MTDKALLRILRDTGFIGQDFRLINAIEDGEPIDDDSTIISDPNIPLTLED